MVFSEKGLLCPYTCQSGTFKVAASDFVDALLFHRFRFTCCLCENMSSKPWLIANGHIVMHNNSCIGYTYRVYQTFITLMNSLPTVHYLESLVYLCEYEGDAVGLACSGSLLTGSSSCQSA
jgi:hypothetical protein